jgi:hypothetical protein
MCATYANNMQMDYMLSSKNLRKFPKSNENQGAPFVRVLGGISASRVLPSVRL